MNKIGEAKSVLNIFEKIHNLCLNGDIQGGNRLITDDQTGIECECTRNPDPLLLASGKLVRIPVGECGIEPNDTHELGDPCSSVRYVQGSVLEQGLADQSPHIHPRIER